MEYLNLIIDKITITNLLRVWNYVMTSNLFNFVFFALVFAWIFKKINVKKIIESLQEKILNIINDAKKNKENSINALSDAQDAVKNLPEELDTIQSDAKKSADVIENKILNEANIQVESINANAQKAIVAEEKLIIANLTKDISKLSIEQARKKVQWELLKDLNLHEKYINQSIDELDRLNF